MKCHRCAKVATLHITEIVKGAPHELHLCEECAREHLNQPAGEDEGSSGELIKSGGDQLEELNKKLCPTCQLSFRDFRNHGRLGCAHCYLAFEEELLPLLENIHGDTRHCGKFPQRAPDDNHKQYQMIKLRNELRQAVAEESYEQAARLRDQIQELETDASRETPP